MNDSEQERSSDEAGPVAQRKKPRRQKTAVSVLAVTYFTLFSVSWSNAQSFTQGLTFSLQVGSLVANDQHAQFYNGQESSPNNIYRILHSPLYGEQIWQDLTTEGLITDAVSNYRLLQIEEYGRMYYRMSLHAGVGLRYDYPSGWGWMAQFGHARLHANGAFLLSRDNNTGLPGEDRYVSCAILGQERRINIDAGLRRTFALRPNFEFGFEVGGRLVNTQVEQNDIIICGNSYNILDLWNGRTPDYTTPEYDYVNQGGIGYGAFLTLEASYTMPAVSAITVGYTLSFEQINLPGFETPLPQHLIFVRFDIYDFFLNL